MRLALAGAIVLTTAMLAASPASAGTVCAGGSVAIFYASDVAAGCPGGTNAASEVNRVTIGRTAGGDITFTDTSVAPVDGDGPGGCTVTGNTATCPGTEYVFDVGGNDDTVTVAAPVPGAGAGGDGADRLVGGPLRDVIDGGDGKDNIDGGDGPDALTGGAGDDTLSGGDDDDSLDGGQGPGATSDNDSLNGGDGEDTAYYRRDAAVAVSLDDMAGDGQPGESDNVHSDIENLSGGNGDDSLTGNDGRNVIDGGPGADSLSGMGGNDVLIDSGQDSAADRLDGGAGDDTMSAGRGPDTYTGGDGEDYVSDYVNRGFAVNVSLDGVADDGSPGEGDNVGPDVEDVSGGAGNDTLVGSAADNELDGGAGDDTISGGDGNDGLNGGAGRDVIDGGAGRDDLVGGAGADTFKTRDGLTDRVNCGGGTDAVQGEARDDIAGNCENLDIAPPTAVQIDSVQVTRAGFAVVRITCPIVEKSCAGAIIVKSVRRIGPRFVKLGQVNYRLRGGDSKVFKAKIAAGDKKPLKRARRVKVRAVVTNVNPDTAVTTSATRLATVTTRGL